MNAPQIAEKIKELHHILKNTDSPDTIANKINSILIHGDQVPINLLFAAWEIFAAQKEVKRSGADVCEQHEW